MSKHVIPALSPNPGVLPNTAADPLMFESFIAIEKTYLSRDTASFNLLQHGMVFWCTLLCIACV